MPPAALEEVGWHELDLPPQLDEMMQLFEDTVVLGPADAGPVDAAPGLVRLLPSAAAHVEVEETRTEFRLRWRVGRAPVAEIRWDADVRDVHLQLVRPDADRITHRITLGRRIASEGAQAGLFDDVFELRLRKVEPSDPVVRGQTVPLGVDLREMHARLIRP